jgi:hypothetical protein
MWALENTTPYAAERTWIRDRHGAEVWLVAVKATFTVAGNGGLRVADEQVPVFLVPQYRGEPAKSSLLYEQDLMLIKPTTDILVHGSAHAPGGKAAEQVDVSFRVGELRKTLRVTGDRRWKVSPLSIQVTGTEPFVTMPITYERAFGGADRRDPNPDKHKWERRNPVGTGFATEKKLLHGQLLPNVEYPDDQLGVWKQQVRPAGFGPVARDWLPRSKFAGTYDEKWEQTRFPLIPEDFDDRFNLAAPPDQQPPRHLTGGEEVELKNLTPQGKLEFTLPRGSVRFKTVFTTGKTVEHSAILHTVVLEPDKSRLSLVWHTALPCHTGGQTLWRTIITRAE